MRLTPCLASTHVNQVDGRCSRIKLRPSAPGKQASISMIAVQLGHFCPVGKEAASCRWVGHINCKRARELSCPRNIQHASFYFGQVMCNLVNLNSGLSAWVFSCWLSLEHLSDAVLGSLGRYLQFAPSFSSVLHNISCPLQCEHRSPPHKPRGERRTSPNLCKGPCTKRSQMYGGSSLMQPSSVS